MKFAVEQDAYAGPFPVLLELLESQELSISSVSLAKIADDFSCYLDEHDVASEELADFLLVASRLIYLKTKELMPYLIVEEEEEGVDLADQMRLYQHFVEYAKGIGGLVAEPIGSYGRMLRKKNLEVYATETYITKKLLRDAFSGLLKRNEPFFLLKQSSIERVESVKERMHRLSNAIQSRAKIGFKEIVSSASSKADVVVSFLALLELLKSRIVKATQGDDHDIIIERV